MNIAYSIALAGAAVTLFFIIVRITNGGMQALYFKIIASLGFIATTMATLWLTDFCVYGVFILAGQILGLLGDIFLDQKMIHKDYDFQYTNIGFIAFGVGHIFFVCAVVLSSGIVQLNAVISGVAALVLLGLVLLIEKPSGLCYGRYIVPVTAYSFVIGFAAVLPFTWLLTAETLPKNLLVFGIGMVSFLISDFVLSQIYFSKRGEIPLLVAVNYLFYYLAQYIISLSVLSAP